MRALENVDMIGKDLTPPLFPLAFSLRDSFLLSHCSSCFSPLPPSNPHHHHASLLYCSPECSFHDSRLHLSSAGHHLLLRRCPPENTSDLRAALRLLLYFENDVVGTRIGGLMSNREKLMIDNNFSERIRDGAKAMAVARRMRDGFDFGLSECSSMLEEVMLCVVLTNAVEVQDNAGCSVGIAIYDTTFSWINHSCSPNACYRFLPPSHGGESRFLIGPAAMHGGREIILTDNGVFNEDEFRKGASLLGYGPRVAVRSIKGIKKGEEVSIAYTDLLQPKEMRQSDLWLKYRFTCRCRRCNVVPLTYVDQGLQDISSFSLNSSNPVSNQSFCEDLGVEKLTEYIDDAISEYLSFGDAESCCEKLENSLLDDSSPGKIRLHPLHYLSLNTYTTLASAYKVRAIELLAKNGDKDENQINAFKMNRISAAYSLLLAGLTHHLFLAESSLIASVAIFWTGAGESLLDFARSTLWNLFPDWQSSSLPSYKCSKCSLMDIFKANFAGTQALNAASDISREFLDCITNRTPEVWRFLVQDNCYLGVIEDPIDLRWIETMKYLAKDSCNAKGSFSRCKEGYKGQDRVGIYQLGIHCLLYGGILSSFCGGQDSYLTSSVRRLLYGEVWN